MSVERAVNLFLDQLDAFVRDLGIEVITPEKFQRERRRLEDLFARDHALTPAEIGSAIRVGAVPESELVQEWLELMALEPYMEVSE